MSFFNKKEDVVHVELTQYGKHLLSKGKFKPTYYAFFDDNILYDSEYGGITEDQNDAEDRIQDTTPQLDVQYVYSGIETEFRKNSKLVRDGRARMGDDIVQPTAEKDFALSTPLGNSSATSTKAPGWEINSLIGKFSNVTHYTTGSQPTTRVPQIDIDIKYEVGIERGEPQPRYDFRGASDASFFADGTQLRVWEDRIVLDVLENNTPFSSENFDIEVFLVEEEDVSGNIKTPGVTKTSKKEVLVPMYFMPKESNIHNEILHDAPPLSVPTPPINPGYVEYFLDLETDFEIDGGLMALARSTTGKKSLFTDKRYGEAPAQREMIRDLYSDGMAPNEGAGMGGWATRGAEGTAEGATAFDGSPAFYMHGGGPDGGANRPQPQYNVDGTAGDGTTPGETREFDSGGPVTAVDDGEVC